MVNFEAAFGGILTGIILGIAISFMYAVIKNRRS